MFRVSACSAALRLVILCLLPGWLTAQQARVDAAVSSEVMLARERFTFQLSFTGARPSNWPDLPDVSPLTFKQKNYFRSRQGFHFDYEVYCYRPGTFTIPAITIQTQQGPLTSQPLTVHFFDAKELSEGTVEVANRTFPYFSGVFVPKTNPFVGEEQKAVVKLLLPPGIRLRNAQLAMLEKDQVAAWRFEPEKNLTSVPHRGQNYSVITYRSTVTPLAAGAVALGPGEVKPVVQVASSRRGFTIWQSHEALLQLPKVEFDARPLPKPAPANFSGAVGDFQITALPTAQSLELGESLTVDLAVTGKGGLEQVQAPMLQAEEGDWKVFDAIRKAEGRERQKEIGTIEFNQVLRPLRKVEQLPSYELVFFDPLLEQYRTVRSAPYPLLVTGEDIEVGVAAAPTPLVAMTGRMRSAPGEWRRYWHVLPGLLTLSGIALWIARKRKARQLASLPRREFENDLAEVKNATSGGRPAFFRAVGRFLDRWPHEEIKEEADTFLRTRDEICFAPEPVGPESEKLLPKEKTRVLKALRRIAPLLLFSLILAPDLSAADLDQLWREKKHQKGREQLRTMIAESPSPGAWFNLALFEDKLGNTYEASLAYHRALASRPELDRERLDALASRTNILIPKERDESEWLSRLPRSVYRELFFLGGWLLILALVICLALSASRWRKRVTWLFFAISPLLLAGSALAWWHYPEGIQHRPLLQASVIKESLPLRLSPHKRAESTRSVAAGSIGHITASRGQWDHLEFAGGITGWIPRDKSTPIAGTGW